MSIFTRDKRGVLGVAILILFILVAAAASLITPYDPVNPPRPTDPNNPPIADIFTKPIWYKYLFFKEDLSENVEPMQDPHFNLSLIHISEPTRPY